MISKLPVVDLVATGKNIRSLRRNQKMEVKDLQKIFWFKNPNTIYKWERGDNLPTVDNLVALSRVFAVPLEHIVATK